MYIMTVKDKLSDYLKQVARNHLVFCHEQIEGLSYVNVGSVLAEGLVGQNLCSPMIAFVAEELLDEILSSPKDDFEIGPYVAIENIGILFEPSLAFNVKSAIDNASTNKVIIIHSDGIIKSDKFYFCQEEDVFFIDLSGLSYTEIK